MKSKVLKRPRSASLDAGGSGGSEVKMSKTKRGGPGYSTHMKSMVEVEEILEK